MKNNAVGGEMKTEREWDENNNGELNVLTVYKNKLLQYYSQQMDVLL